MHLCHLQSKRNRRSVWNTALFSSKIHFLQNVTVQLDALQFLHFIDILQIHAAEHQKYFTVYRTINIHWTQCKVSIATDDINVTNHTLEEEESVPLCFQGCDETCYSLVWLQHPVARGTSAEPAKTSHSFYFSNLGMFDGILWITFANLCRASFVLLGNFCNHRVLQDHVWVAVSI